MRRAIGPDAHFCRHPARCATAIKLSEDRRQKVGHPERSQRGTSCEVKDPAAITMDGVPGEDLETNAIFASGPGSFSRLKLHQDDRLHHHPLALT